MKLKLGQVQILKKIEHNNQIKNLDNEIKKMNLKLDQFEELKITFKDNNGRLSLNLNLQQL